MKNLLALLLLPALAYGNINQTIEDIDERLTDIEISNSQRRIDVGMEMHMFAGHISNDNAENKGVNYDEQHFKNNFRLKFAGILNKDFQAYASLQASYNFNSQVQTRQAEEDDMTQPARGSRPYVRTAYFDWRLNKYTVLSAGRLPTTSGPPEHMKHGRGRLGTYPLVSFNLPLDGVSFTFKTPRILKDTDLSFRTIYIHGGVSDTQQPHKGEPYNSTTPTSLAKGHDGFTQMFELETKPRSNDWFDSLLVIGQYSYLKMATFKDFTRNDQLIVGSVPGVTVDNNIYRFAADNNTLARLQIATIYLEAQKLLNSNFDFYFSHMRSWNKPVANIKATVISSAHGATPEGTVIDAGQFISSGDTQGTRTLYGMRYNFKNSFVGADYWKTTSYPIPNDLYSDDFIPLGLLAGEVYHVYYTHMFYNKDLSVRVGYQTVNDDKFFGTFNYTESNQKISALYTALFVTY